MLAEDLGASYVLDSYRHRFFRREADNRVYKLENIGRVEGRRGAVEYFAFPLLGGFSDAHWGDLVSIPEEELQDMAAFAHPQLGYRHTPNGAGLYFLTRRISTHRGLYHGNLDTTSVARASNAAELTHERKAWLAYNNTGVSLIDAVSQLNQRGASVRGFAITPQFAVARKAGDRDNYTLHYNGRACGEVNREGTTTFRIEAVKRLFDKVT